jgi:hypothetical protein
LFLLPLLTGRSLFHGLSPTRFENFCDVVFRDRIAAAGASWIAPGIMIGDVAAHGGYSCDTAHA